MNKLNDEYNESLPDFKWFTLPSSQTIVCKEDDEKQTDKTTLPAIPSLTASIKTEKSLEQNTNELVQEMSQPKVEIVKGPPNSHRMVSIMRIPLKTKKSQNRWSTEEDDELHQLVLKHGAEKWSNIAETMTTTRTGRQCRERYLYFLKDRYTNKKEWNTDEEQQIIDIHSEDGNDWSKMSQKLANRSNLAIKNHFYVTQRKAQTAFKKSRLNTFLPRKNKSNLLFDYCFRILVLEQSTRKRKRDVEKEETN